MEEKQKLLHEVELGLLKPHAGVQCEDNYDDVDFISDKIMYPSWIKEKDYSMQYQEYNADNDECIQISISQGEKVLIATANNWSSGYPNAHKYTSMQIQKCFILLLTLHCIILYFLLCHSFVFMMCGFTTSLLCYYSLPFTFIFTSY